jgi:PLP dependent protein
MIQLDANLAAVRTRIDDAARSSGRNSDDVQILPVTKSVPSEVACALARRGCLELAENRAEGLASKVEALRSSGLDVHWHFVGHLQRNKVARVVAKIDVLHSVDSLRLIETLSRVTRESGRSLAVYLQVHLTGEDEKHGFAPGEVSAAVRLVHAAEHLELLGLMAMGPREESAEVTARGVFEQVVALGTSLTQEQPQAFPKGRCGYSLGMSGDLEQAVHAGSTCIRVGGALYSGVDPQHPEAEGAQA